LDEFIQIKTTLSQYRRPRLAILLLSLPLGGEERTMITLANGLLDAAPRIAASSAEPGRADVTFPVLPLAVQPGVGRVGGRYRRLCQCWNRFNPDVIASLCHKRLGHGHPTGAQRTKHSTHSACAQFLEAGADLMGKWVTIGIGATPIAHFGGSARRSREFCHRLKWIA
jgi:hypothetical protein